MKVKTLLLLPLVMLVACTSTNEPSNSTKGKYNILFKAQSPYLDWYSSNLESFLSYHSKLNGDTVGNSSERVSRAEDNTITLKNDMRIRVHDAYTMQRDEKETTLQLTRTTKVLSDKSNAPHRAKMDNPIDSITHTYSYTLQTALPFTLIRPAADPCNPIPLCYYDNFIVEWNEDIANENGVILIAEWNGVTAHGPTQNTSIANVDLVEDTGLATLNTDLFEGMPDEALVDLWFIRGNLITINGNDGEVLLNDVLNDSPDVMMDLLTAHPELGLQLQPFMFGTGAVYQFSFFLVREL